MHKHIIVVNAIYVMQIISDEIQKEIRFNIFITFFYNIFYNQWEYYSYLCLYALQILPVLLFKFQGHFFFIKSCFCDWKNSK